MSHAQNSIFASRLRASIESGYTKHFDVAVDYKKYINEKSIEGISQKGNKLHHTKGSKQTLEKLICQEILLIASCNKEVPSTTFTIGLC